MKKSRTKFIISIVIFSVLLLTYIAICYQHEMHLRKKIDPSNAVLRGRGSVKKLAELFMYAAHLDILPKKAISLDEALDLFQKNGIFDELEVDRNDAKLDYWKNPMTLEIEEVNNKIIYTIKSMHKIEKNNKLIVSYLLIWNLSDNTWDVDDKYTITEWSPS